MEIVMKTWIIVSDSCGARVFETTDEGRTLHFVWRLAHTESRSMEADLAADKRGSSGSSDHRGASTMDPHQSRKEVEAGVFARVLARNLHSAFDKRQFSALILVAEPHFLGLLREALDTGTARAVVASL